MSGRKPKLQANLFIFCDLSSRVFAGRNFDFPIPESRLSVYGALVRVLVFRWDPVIWNLPTPTTFLHHVRLSRYQGGRRAVRHAQGVLANGHSQLRENSRPIPVRGPAAQVLNPVFEASSHL